ncbi:hypothetical protein GCM10028799_68290 [Kribbella italica]
MKQVVVSVGSRVVSARGWGGEDWWLVEEVVAPAGPGQGRTVAGRKTGWPLWGRGAGGGGRWKRPRCLRESEGRAEDVVSAGVRVGTGGSGRRWWCLCGAEGG